MNKYDPIICKTLREKFNTVWKRVENYETRRELPKEEEKINKYVLDLISEVNEINEYYIRIFLNESKENRAIIQEHYSQIFEKVNRAFIILRVKYPFKKVWFEILEPKPNNTYCKG